ncbi:Polycomb group RING finger protein 3 [Nymphon striatum]|nr:Polycomb group RING finger protein 3 [Nymphon striatum]
MDRKVKLKTLNAFITCKLCKGYLIEATTVTECLHTFCKTCLVKHLEENNSCPTCNIVIHQSHPLQYISFDRTMQDVVCKLVPNLVANELIREKEFYKKRGIPYPKLNNELGKEQEVSSTVNNTNVPCTNGTDPDCHRRDEQVNILLESSQIPLKQMRRKFIRCSAQATITHLKKFIAKKIFNNLEKYRDVDILCNQEILGKDHTVKFVCVTRWRFKDPPLKLYYQPKIDL